MNFNYLVQPGDLAGGAIPNCGTIHQSEIASTLFQLSKELNLQVDLNDYIIGSTGKREYSGDIDLVLDKNIYNKDPGSFRNELICLFGQENVARNGNMVHLKYPIVGYNSTFQLWQPRTGFVQIDFNFGDVNWERFYHYSPGPESAYKGGHRNLAIAAICTAVNLKISNILDTWDRPIVKIKWQWGARGFMKINRHSVPTPEGYWEKNQIDSILEGPYFDGNIIAKKLFPDDGMCSDLNSLETIMSAVKRNYSLVDQERIWKQIAYNFSEWKVGRSFIYPDEIARYYSVKR